MGTVQKVKKCAEEYVRSSDSLFWWWSRSQRPSNETKTRREEIEMKAKKFNVFVLIARLLRVAQPIAQALKDKHIDNSERDEIVGVLLQEITGYLDELMR